MRAGLTIKKLKGKEIIPYIPELAKLRIKIFKEYPYLYVGDMQSEMEYLDLQITCSENLLVLVIDRDQIVGASTAFPLKFQTDEVKKTFIEHNIKVQDVFYLSESVLLPNYRGQKIYRHFFHERETAAIEYGSKITTFCAVDRSLDDPRRPQNYVPLDDVWKHFGYQKHSELYTYFEWKEIDEAVKSPKKLIFWLKYL